MHSGGGQPVSRRRLPGTARLVAFAQQAACEVEYIRSSDWTALEIAKSQKFGSPHTSATRKIAMDPQTRHACQSAYGNRRP